MRDRSLIRPLAVIVGALSLGAACGSPQGPCQDPNDPVLTCDSDVELVTTQRVHDEIISQRCVPCHAPGKLMETIDMSTPDKAHATLVDQPSSSYQPLKKVSPNNLKESTLWLKVMGGSPAGRQGPNCEQVGPRMPGEGEELTDDQKALIKSWICSGATKE